MRRVALPFGRFTLLAGLLMLMGTSAGAAEPPAREFNGPYTGLYLSRVAFPIGGMGAGMFCLEGSGASSHVSIRNQMDFMNEPTTFAAVCVLGADGEPNVARVLEGPIPEWKYFGRPGTGNGGTGTTYGFPRFRQVEFLAEFQVLGCRLSQSGQVSRYPMYKAEGSQ